MSPDIHWHVGEDAEQETIADTTSARRSRRSWIAIVVVIFLGVGLGMAYRSLPEPAPRPTPALSPTPEIAAARPAIPATLFQTIDREAQALADGDFEAYQEVHASNEIEGRTDGLAAWGRSGTDRPVYEILDFEFPTETRAWADIRQFRNGRYFRLTRFYMRVNDRWQSSLRFSWRSGQEETLQTPHFDVIYAVEDRDVLTPTLRQLEEDYQSLCRDLDCTTLGHELTFTVRMTHANVPFVYSASTDNGEIWLPSPRVAGFFESGRPYVWSNNPVHWVLAQAIIDRAYSTVNYDQPGGGFLWAGGVWAVEHIDPLPPEIWNELGNVTQKSLLSPETLWEVGRINEPGPALIQLILLLRFSEEEYGTAAVTQLLGTINSATSMSDAVETGLGVSFSEYDQKWQAWVKQNISKP